MQIYLLIRRNINLGYTFIEGAFKTEESVLKAYSSLVKTLVENDKLKTSASGDDINESAFFTTESGYLIHKVYVESVTLME